MKPNYVWVIEVDFHHYNKWFPDSVRSSRSGAVKTMRWIKKCYGNHKYRIRKYVEVDK